MTLELLSQKRNLPSVLFPFKPPQEKDIKAKKKQKKNNQRLHNFQNPTETFLIFLTLIMKGIIDMKDFIYAAKLKGFAEKGNIIHSEDMFIQIITGLLCIRYH